MEGKARLLGHSLHPLLIPFPLGLLSTAVIFDVLHLVWGNPVFGTVSYWMVISGIVGGLVAAPFGWIDWFAVPQNTRAKRIGLAHGLANTVVLLLFAGSFYLRMGHAENPSMVALVLSFLGFAVALVGGWLGGELVERLGISVHTGANADAPSSLIKDPPLTGASAEGKAAV